MTLEPQWDWYSATLGGVEGVEVVEQLRGLLPCGEVVQMDGRHGFACRDELMAGRARVATVSYGGSQPRVLVEGTGGRAPALVTALRATWPEHRVTRADSAIDWDDEKAWATVSGLALAIANRRGLRTSVAGDWIAGEHGRTLYVGGRLSNVRMRVYEKGLQEVGPDVSPHWVRAELVVRPEKAAKALLARVGPLEAWGTSPWAAEAVEGFLGAPVARLPMRHHVTPDDVRGRAAMLHQYGALMLRWAEDYGDWTSFGQVLGMELGSLGFELGATPLAS